jgi:hypothetical protein
MHRFMCAPNVFAIMGVAAGVPPHGPLPAAQAILQIEHENGTSLRVAVPYQVVSPGKLDFGNPTAFRLPPVWPSWRTGTARERVTQRVPSRLSGRELLEELHA